MLLRAWLRSRFPHGVKLDDLVQESFSRVLRARAGGAAMRSPKAFLFATVRVSLNRGPNSLLFGIGNPAGTINISLRKAQLGRNRNEITARYGSNRSYRSSLDVNRVLVPDRLAFRLDTVSEQNNFDQKPACNRNGRLYGKAGTVRVPPERAWFLTSTFQF